MSFVCPECGRGALRITATLELSPDAWWDEIAVQAVECRACGLRGAAAYRESRRGSLDSEVVDHTGWHLPAQARASLVARIAACPNRGDHNCPCESHRTLSRTDDSGEWCGVAEAFQPFPMRHA